MTFVQLQDEVILDRFSEHISAARRTSVKRWINTRYGRIWNAEPWTFRRENLASTTLNSGSNSVTPTNLGVVWKLYDVTSGLSAPVELDALETSEFYDWYYAGAGNPGGYTVINGVIYFDRPASSTRTYRIIHLLGFTELVADGDTPLLPVEHHMTLVVAAAAEGLKIEGDPAYKQYEEEVQMALSDMRANYLSDSKPIIGARPSWP
jgi:hypothetical protein